MPSKIRSFLEENAPQSVQLYDAFVRYILANVKDGDVLGFDLLDVVFMDQVSVVSDKLLKNYTGYSGKSTLKI